MITPLQQSKKSRSPKAVSNDAWWTGGWWPFAFIVACCLLVYGKTLQFALVDFDDIPLAFLPQTTVSMSDLLFPAAGQSFGFYRPFYFFLLYLTDTVFASNQMMGLHLLSLALHGFAGSMMFVLFAEIGWKRATASIVACIVVLHPILTMAVAWTPGSNDAALTALACAAWIFLLRYLCTEHPSDLVWHGVLTLFMLLTKETALVVPFLYAASLFVVKKRPANKTIWILGAIWLLLVGGVVALLLRNAAITPPQPRSLYGLSALLHSWQAFPELVGKMLMPVNLSVYPAFTPVATLLGCVIGIPFFVGTALSAWRLGVFQWWWFGMMWVTFTLLPPLLAFVPTGNTVEFDYLEHRAYVPLVGIALILGTLWEAALVQHSKQGQMFSPRIRRLGRYAAIGLLCGFAVMSFLRAEVFRERESFWVHAAQSHPRSAASVYAMLGVQFAQGRQFDEASTYFTKAYSLEPNNVYALTGMATVALSQKRVSEAASFLDKAYTIDSTSPDVMVGKAHILRLTRPPLFAEHAQALAEHALQANPHHVPAYIMLVYVNALRGRIAEVQQNLTMAAHYGEDSATIRSLAAQYLQASH
jgi:hypothetical protein